MEKKDLKPAGVFKYFEEICQVPRPSKKEEKMIAYLKAFGAKHNLETKVDEAGNVLKSPLLREKKIFKPSFCNRISTWCAKRITMFNMTSSPIPSKLKLTVNG